MSTELSTRDGSDLFPMLEESARTGVHVAGIRIATYAVALVASILIGRSLGPDGRGRYALPMAVLAIAMTLGSLGLEHAQIFLVGRGRALPGLWANATAVGIGVSVVTFALLAAVTAMGASGATPVSWLWVTFAQMPLLLQVLYWTNLLQLSGRIRAALIASLAGALAQAAGVVWLASTGTLTPFRVIVLSTAGNVITWGFVLAACRSSRLVSRRLDLASLSEGIRFGLRAQLGIIFVFLLFRLDQVLVQRILGFEALGLYSLAVTLAELLWLLSDPFATALLRHQVSADGDDDVRLAYATGRVALLAIVVVAAIAWVAAPWAIRLAYGEAFGGAVWPFRLLLPGIVALAVQRPLAAVILKRGRPLLVSAFGGGVLVVNVVMNLALLRRFGPAAASVSSSVAYVCLAVTYVTVTRVEGIAATRSLVPGRQDLARLGRALHGSLMRSAR